ncbi:protein cereblon-like [Vanessa cardui]|uniref:protein cereblon-like n=1 Tax=Vanessa cardui TaxID=171605 RepID=UPI001F12B258|nr:protein cereblon-like [Vanessa cardui]
MEDNVPSDREEGPNDRGSGSERRGGGSSENDEESDEEEQQFDISLAASHSYMGNGLVQVSGRSVLEAGWTGRVPVIAHHGAVFPGETVPMLLTNERDAAVISRAIQQDKLFGLLCPDESGTLVSGYGVLCEVFEADAGVGEGEGEGPRSLSFKARATHRFRCVHVPKQSVPIHAFSRMRTVEVRVLPEVRLGDPLRPARLASLDALRRARTPLDARLRSMDAVVTPWPLFVYDIFDYRRMRQIIKDYFRTMSLENLPEEAVSLSFWTASNLALSARDRLALFAVDDALLRLHMEVRLIARKSVLCCSSCAVEIARREHIFAMSSEGVHSNYTNLGGYMHDIVTVSRASNTELSGAPSAEFSWFPGYAWTIALCAACLAHVGWRFDAQRRGLRPQQFYGLCRNYVQPRCDAGDAGDAGAAGARSLSAELRAARRALSALVYAPRDDADP